MKKKERAQTKGKDKESEAPQDGPASTSRGAGDDVPIKKRRLVNGSELVFRVPGEDSDEEERDAGDVIEKVMEVPDLFQEAVAPAVPPKITIYDSDN